MLFAFGESQGGHRHQRPLSRRQLRQLAADGGAVASDNTNLKTAEYRALWDASAVVSCIVFMVVEYKLFVELSPIIETILSSKRCPDDVSKTPLTRLILSFIFFPICFLVAHSWSP